MAEDTYYTITLPILEAIAAAEGTDFLQAADVASETGVDQAKVEAEIQRLIHDGYLLPTWEWTGGGFLTSPVLGEKGARAILKWPSNDPYEALLALLD